MISIPYALGADPGRAQRRQQERQAEHDQRPVEDAYEVGGEPERGLDGVAPFSLASSRATVRRLIPSRRAISRRETPSAANAHTCAHSNALRTSAPVARQHRPSEPRRRGGRDQRRHEWRTFRLPIPAQYWTARVTFTPSTELLRRFSIGTWKCRREVTGMDALARTRRHAPNQEARMLRTSDERTVGVASARPQESRPRGRLVGQAPGRKEEPWPV